MDSPEEYVIEFERFWTWLQRHANCIIEAGSPDAVLFDHDDFHWQIDETPDRQRIVQLLRGKDLVGELVVEARQVLAVHAVGIEEGRCRFDLVAAQSDEAVRYFVLSHGFEENQRHARALQH